MNQKKLIRDFLIFIDENKKYTIYQFLKMII